MTEQPDKKAEIPTRLLDGLKNIEDTGAVPMLIPLVLETFLTEQGIYSSSMTPVDAWEALRRVRDGGEGEPLTSAAAKAQAQPSPDPTPAQPPAPAKLTSPLNSFRRKNKKRNH